MSRGSTPRAMTTLTRPCSAYLKPSPPTHWPSSAAKPAPTLTVGPTPRSATKPAPSSRGAATSAAAAAGGSSSSSSAAAWRALVDASKTARPCPPAAPPRRPGSRSARRASRRRAGPRPPPGLLSRRDAVVCATRLGKEAPCCRVYYPCRLDGRRERDQGLGLCTGAQPGYCFGHGCPPCKPRHKETCKNKGQRAGHMCRSCLRIARDLGLF